MKNNYVQALEMTHRNIGRILDLPCVTSVSKTYSSEFVATVEVVAPKYKALAFEGDWFVQLERGWDVLTAKEWEQYNK